MNESERFRGTRRGGPHHARRGPPPPRHLPGGGGIAGLRPLHRGVRRGRARVFLPPISCPWKKGGERIGAGPIDEAFHRGKILELEAELARAHAESALIAPVPREELHRFLVEERLSGWGRAGDGTWERSGEY